MGTTELPKRTWKAGACAVSLCALLAACRAQEQADKLYAERTIRFHKIFVDEYDVIGEHRVFDILRKTDVDPDRALDLDLGLLGQRFAEGGDGNDRIQAGSQEKVVIFGGLGDDDLTGSRESDLLAGEGGKDTLRSGAGQDYLIIDEFDDFDGGPDMDRAIYVGTANLDLNISDHKIEIFNSGAGDDFISTDLTMEAAIHGGPGKDHLYGGYGKDWLAGGTDPDVLEGGYGDDTYIFARGDGCDTVTDFSFNRRTAKVYDVYSDGSKQNYREKIVRLREHAGRDRILFGRDIAPRDLVILFDGVDLLVGVKPAADLNVSFEDIADQIRLSNWKDSCDQIEFFEFPSGTTIDIARLIKVYDITDRTSLFDLGKMTSFGAYGYDKKSKLAQCDRREETVSVREIDPPSD